MRFSYSTFRTIPLAPLLFALGVQASARSQATLVSGDGTTAAATLLWENRQQSSETDGGALLAIAAAGDMVFAAGNVRTGPLSEPFSGESNYDGFVRAVVATTGETIWEDRFDVGFFDRAQQIATEGHRVFASGWVRSTTTRYDFLVRAYDAGTGELLWQNVVDKAGFSDFSEALVAAGGRVFSAGQIRAATPDYYVRAMNAETGASLWEDTLDLGGQEFAFAAAIKGDHLVIAGSAIAPFTFVPSLIVRTYDSRTGELLWQAVTAEADNIFARRNGALAVHGNVVFTGGANDHLNPNGEFLIHAYDIRTGTLLWLDEWPSGGVFSTVVDLAVSGGQLFAGGYSFDGVKTFVRVRAYQTDTGALLWEHQWSEDSLLNDLDATNGEVIVAGIVAGPPSDVGFNNDYIVRSHDARTGAVVWQDQVDISRDAATAVTVRGRRVFVAGNLGDAPGIRAYSLAR